MVEENNLCQKLSKAYTKLYKNLHLYPCNMKFSSVLLEAVHYTFSSWGLLKQLSAKVGHSYECTTSTTNLKLIAVNSSSANVSLEKIEFQPFDVHNGKLGEGENKII